MKTRAEPFDKRESFLEAACEAAASLRLYQAPSARGENWLVAPSHPRLAKVLEALQREYQRNWSLEDLANFANMSRSGLALTFKKTVGVAPMVYLMHWRMQVACELLLGGDEAVGTIANAVGYGSESAFSVAFQKVLRCRPGAYRKRQTLRME